MYLFAASDGRVFELAARRGMGALGVVLRGRQPPRLGGPRQLALRGRRHPRHGHLQAQDGVPPSPGEKHFISWNFRKTSRNPIFTYLQI